MPPAGVGAPPTPVPGPRGTDGLATAPPSFDGFYSRHARPGSGRSTDPASRPHRRPGRAVHARTPGAVRARAAERAPCRRGACASGSAGCRVRTAAGAPAFDRPVRVRHPCPCRAGMDDLIARAAEWGGGGSGSGACVLARGSGNYWQGERVVAGRRIDLRPLVSGLLATFMIAVRDPLVVQ